jgi:hypothetical protein
MGSDSDVVILADDVDILINRMCDDTDLGIADEKVAISASHHGVDGIPGARRGEAIAESFGSDCRATNAGKLYPPEI